MPETTIANLWSPPIWIRGTDEAARRLPALLTSGAVAQSPQLDAIAAGSGISATMPFLRDITDQAEVVQVEAGAITVNNITGSTNVVPILNRELGFGVNALAKAVTGEDVVGGITMQLGLNRQKRTQATILSVLRGLFNVAGAPSAAAILSDNRAEHFLEAGASPAAGQLIDGTKFNNAAAKLGELQDSLRGGAFWCHSLIRAALLNQDATSFERVSRGDFILETYKGIPIYVSDLLVRAGGTSGVVYDSYLLGARSVGWGEKPQVGDQIDVASLQYELKKGTNQEAIYDRRRYLVHVDGTRWTGTPAAQSASNTELATSTNWALAYATADRIPVVCIRTNG